MSAATAEEVLGLVGRLRDALIAMGRLIPEDAERIEDLMRTMGLGFGESAVRLGLVTPAELAEALQATGEIPQHSAAGSIAMGKLTPDGVVRIEQTMRTLGLGFAEAAIHLGIVTPEDLGAANEKLRQHAPHSSDAIFDGTLHKLHPGRGLPVKYVGIVKAGPSLIVAREPDSPYSEQIRTLRTELLLLNRASHSGNLIVILSPCRGEGRTQLCAELAIAFSQLGQRTLLVDADLRRPRVHKLFEADNIAGLGPALASGGHPNLLRVENLPHLSVLMAGVTVPNPLELLTNGHFQRQMADWRKKYNTVIIDTPPISEFADGLAIASFAEQVVIVSRSHSTPHRNLKEMLRRMGGTQSRIVGAVVNNF